jgi:translation elongation factor EF-4
LLFKTRANPRARGITVKAQSVSLLHESPADGHKYLLNLIDTPGKAIGYIH